jgi:hypothetical protein
MANFDSKPKLVPREYKDGSGWYILATWEDGSQVPEQIGGFHSDSEAYDWISLKSESYFKVRRRDR